MAEDRLKFRAWSKATSKYLDLLLLTPLALDSNLNQKGIFIPFSKKLIIEQCTGLKDDNGKLIYEGDIVQQTREDNMFPGDKKLVVVVGIELPEYEALSDWGSGGPDGNYPIKECEIIGNIHEHPELLKDND